MIGDAHADRMIFLAALGRSGLTWYQSKAQYIAHCKHKKTVKVCKTCKDEFADYTIKWKSRSGKWYTTYHCAQCIRQKVGDYFARMQRDMGRNLQSLDHEAVATTIVLSQDQIEQDDYRDYDLKDIAKHYLQRIQNEV